MFYEPRNGHGLPRDPFKSLVVPRPIGWISSVDATGRVNLAPYSFFNAVASAPPIVIFAPGGQHREGGLKDTIVNVESTGEFVCNLATWDTRESMNKSSAPAPRDVDEFALAGLTPVPSKLVTPPRVKESPVHLECKHLRTIDLPATDPSEPNHTVFGEVVGIHIDDRFIKDGRIDVSALRPIARLGYMDYAVVEEFFTMMRPDYP